MSEIYSSIMTGLTEALEDAQSTEKTLKRNTVTIVPVKKYHAADVQKIRKSTGFSQRLFASYLGVSTKTVEAWEAGTNQPSGAASRLLNMLELNSHLIEEFPFVQRKEKNHGIRA